MSATKPYNAFEREDWSFGLHLLAARSPVCLRWDRHVAHLLARHSLNSTLEEENLFSVSATKSALLLFLVWERVVSPVENPKLPLIALHGGAAVAAAGINGISVYGVITPTLPMDKRCHWTPVTNCAAFSSTTNCSLSMWSRSCPLEYASCRAFQSSILKCRLLYSC